MRINISGKNIDLTDAIRETIEKKLGKLDKFLPEDAAAHVVVHAKKNVHKIEVTIPLKKHIIRAEERDTDLYRAIDAVEDVLERQIRKYKTKVLSKRNESIRTAEIIEAAPAAEEIADASMIESDVAIEIVRSKKVTVKPMSPEEACLQMDLLDHSFFMFRNADTEEINVVYKRADGAYGLIEPE